MKFSVVIPAYNAEKFICRSVESVLNQTFEDFEVIVINDGSSDNTLKALEDICDVRLGVINKENEGVSVARNTGINNASGEYICFLDADDEYLANHLDHLNKMILNNQSCGFYSTRFCMSKIDDPNDIDMPRTSGKIIYYENFVKETLVTSEKIWTGCICVRRELFEKYGMFEPNVKLGEDVDMWKRIYVHTGVVFSDNVTVKRNRDGSKATKQYMRMRSFKVDLLDRMPSFLSDSTISEEIKESLRTEHELQKLSVARSFLIIGDKKKAKDQLKTINKKRIPTKRWLVTKICLIVPSCVIKGFISFKNRGLYE